MHLHVVFTIWRVLSIMRSHEWEVEKWQCRAKKNEIRKKSTVTDLHTSGDTKHLVALLSFPPNTERAYAGVCECVYEYTKFCMSVYEPYKQQIFMSKHEDIVYLSVFVYGVRISCARVLNIVLLIKTSAHKDFCCHRTSYYEITNNWNNYELTLETIFWSRKKLKNYGIRSTVRNRQSLLSKY